GSAPFLSRTESRKSRRRTSPSASPPSPPSSASDHAYENRATGCRGAVHEDPVRHGSAEFRASLLDAVAGADQFLLVRGVGDAEMRRQAKGLAIHHRDGLAVQEIDHEVEIAVDDVALRRALADDARAARIDVERAFDARAM